MQHNNYSIMKKKITTHLGILIFLKRKVKTTYQLSIILLQIKKKWKLDRKNQKSKPVSLQNRTENGE